MILFDLQNTRNNLREEGGRLRRPSTTVDYILIRTSNLETYMTTFFYSTTTTAKTKPIFPAFGEIPMWQTKRSFYYVLNTVLKMPMPYDNHLDGRIILREERVDLTD